MDAGKARIFFSAGEPSGDLHGANLLRELRAQWGAVEAVGFGGPALAQAGCTLLADLTALAVMWFARVLVNLHTFWALLAQADRFFRQHRPDAVVLIDYPGFNWWVARRAKAHGIPVFYYTPPQIWAWAQWRVKKMRALVDHVLCSLPFEEPWFRSHGCNATFVGHPFFDEVRRQRLDEGFMGRYSGQGGPLVTILPGSRTQEVTHNLRWFLRAAQRVHQAVPEVRFAVAAFKPHQAEIARKAAATTALPLEVHCGRTPELIRLAHCCMAVSGSVSLELLYHAKPSVILYWINPAAYLVQRFFRKVKYITLVNLLVAEELFPRDRTPYHPSQPDAHRVLYPEYLTWQDRSAEIAEHIIGWLRDPLRRQALVERLRCLAAEVGHRGASQRAAQYILAALERPPSRTPARVQPGTCPPAKPLRG